MKKLFFLVLLVFQSSIYAQNVLFTATPVDGGSPAPITPILQTINEWELSFNLTLVNQTNKTLTIPLPDALGNFSNYTAHQTFYREYDSGEIQWIGSLQAQDPFSNETHNGEIIINIVNDRPFSVIELRGEKFEIFTDVVADTRLNRISIEPPGNDYANTSASLNGQILSGPVPDISEIDILVLIDLELSTGNALSRITDKIIVEKLNADAILALSGTNTSRGIPININIIGITPFDVPDSLEPLIPSNHNNLSCYNMATCSSISNQIQSIRDSQGADLVALFVDYDPGDVCGFAYVPSSQMGADSQFANSFSMHADSCTAAQFLFFHEITHNIGSAHESSMDPSISSYAHGFSDDDADIATLMGCDDTPSPPITETCNRFLRLSSPNDFINGTAIGNSFSNNVRMMSECTTFPGGNIDDCARERAAQRKSNPSPGDSPPSVDITMPDDTTNLIGTQTMPYTLSADVMDTQGITSIQWSVTNIDTAVTDLIGSGASTSTTAFSIPGEYVISVTAVDTIGQLTTDSQTLIVVEGIDIEADVNIVGTTEVQTRIINNSTSEDADLVAFTATVSSGAGTAGITNVPNECSLVSTSSPAHKFYREYYCEVLSIAKQSNFTLSWDMLCPGDAGDDDPQLHFEIILESSQQIDTTPSNNIDTDDYFSGFCTGS